MATLDIDRGKFYDPRIVQLKPKIAIQQGALSISSAPFAALSQSASQLSFQIQTPSQGTFLDRRLTVTGTWTIRLDVQTTQPANEPVLQLGRDAALCAYPLHSLFSTASVNLGDATITTNLAQSFQTLIRLLDSHKTRVGKTCPSALDVYASYNDLAPAGGSTQVHNSPLLGYGHAAYEELNGASADIVFIDPVSGSELVGSGTYVFDGKTIHFTNGTPVIKAGVDAPAGNTYPLFFRITSSELLMVSPFQYKEDQADSSGIFSLQNVAVTLNVQTPETARLIRQTNVYGREVVAQPTFFVAPGQSSPWSKAEIHAQFLTPPLSLPLAPRSVVPYQEFVSYQYPYRVLPGENVIAVSNTLSLPVIPEAIIITVTPVAYGPTEASWFLPIKAITLSYSNMAGLLSSHTQTQLYRISAENGLNMTFSQWRGRARAGYGGIVRTVGGPLVLAPGKDITLSEGEAPGLVSNTTVQATLTVDNNYSMGPRECMVTIMCINSGFVVSERGQSRILRGLVTQSDVLAAPMIGTNSDMGKLVGRGVTDKLANAYTKARDFVNGPMPKAVKEVANAVKTAVTDLAHRIY